MDCRERLGANFARRDTHDVQLSGRMSAWSQIEPVHVWMQFQQLLGRCGGYKISPGLVDLFNDIECPVLDGMKPDRIEFHALEHIERVATLRGNPVVSPLCRSTNGVEQTVSVIDRLNKDSSHLTNRC